MLIIKLDTPRDDETYQTVVDLLSDYGIVSAAWEEEAKKDKAQSGLTGNDLGSNLSLAIDKMRDKRDST